MNTFLSFVRILYVNIIFIISASGCQTIRDQEQEKKQAEDILKTRKSLVISYINKGQARIAHRELRSAIKMHPKDPDFKNLMGLVYLVLKNPEKASQYFKESLKIEKKPAVYLNLSSAYIESQQYPKAFKLLNALKNSKQFKSYRFPERISHNLGLIAERMEKWNLAENYYKEALAENPQYYMSMMRLGAIYEKSKRTKLAIDQFRNARSTCNLCFDPISALSINYLNEGLKKNALVVVKTYLQQEKISERDKTRALKLLRLASRAKTKNKNQISRMQNMKRPQKVLKGSR